MTEKDKKKSGQSTDNRKKKIEDIFKKAVKHNGKALKKLSEK